MGQRLVFKLGELKCLSIYWDPDYKPVTTTIEGSPDIIKQKDSFLKEMDDMIPRGTDDTNVLHHYILQPVTAKFKVLFFL